MRIERSVTTVSWIPSELMDGLGRVATKTKLAHDDVPPPDSFGPDVAETIRALCDADRVRFANHLRAWIEVDDDGCICGHGHLGGGTIGATKVALGPTAISVQAVQLPDQQSVPDVADDHVTFTQTVGCRTGAPMPRAVKHPPFVRYHGPIVWTTLELTIRADGTSQGRVVGASGFPRHWAFDDGGALFAKSTLADYKAWMSSGGRRRTPWGDEDSPASMSEVESLLERELQGAIMRGDRPAIRRVKRGCALVEQGGDDTGELSLLLNGVLVVEVDGAPVAEIGPGAVAGERASLGDGPRSATLRAVTDCKVAAADVDRVDAARLSALAEGHRREDGRS